MSRCWVIRRCILVILALFLTCSAAVFAQDSDAPEHVRKVVRRVVPGYPELARRMGISGTVRLMAVIAPSGSVKFVEPVGGHPVLVKSAEDAVMKWKFASATAETKELIELHFSPE
jgi:TonB family protein